VEKKFRYAIYAAAFPEIGRLLWDSRTMGNTDVSLNPGYSVKKKLQNFGEGENIHR